MGKHIIFMILMLIFWACLTCAVGGYCADDEDYVRGEAPPGMKIEKVGDLNLQLPKDAEVKRTGKGGLLDVETIDKYAARKLEELEDRIKSLEEGQEALRKEIEALKENLSQSQNRSLVSP